VPVLERHPTFARAVVICVSAKPPRPVDGPDPDALLAAWAELDGPCLLSSATLHA
jgi:hypothetical protein